MPPLRRLPLLLALLTACAPFQPDVAAPADGFQLVTPALTVPEGEEWLWCSFFPALEEDLYVAKVEGYQGPGGHHAALFVADVPPKDLSKPQRCDGQTNAPEMTGWRFIGGGDSRQAGDPLPAGVGMVIPAGKALMVQSHYVAGPGGVHARDVVNVTKFAGTPSKIADFWAVGQVSGLVVPPGESQVGADCEITEDISVVYVLGHTHEFGTLMKMELIREGEAPRQLYYETNGPLMRNDPPRERFPVDAPLELRRGDKIRYSCGWSNDSGKALPWPLEMCQGLMLYFPSHGFKVCNAGEY